MPFDTSNTSPIAAYVCTDDGAAVARSALDLSVGHSDDLHGGGLSGAARICNADAGGKVIIAEIGNISVEMACECVEVMCQSGADVIVLGAQTDITTYRALINAGALEYFTLPVTAEEILSVKRSVTQNAQIPAAQPDTSVCVAVIGSGGGVGASLLAQNLAVHVAAPQGGKTRTALVDADIQFGSQAVDLDRDETLGLFEALMSPDRMDGTFIAATMDHLTPTLSMYSHQVRNGQDAQPYLAALPRLYPALSAEFDAVITDLPRSVLMQTPDLAALFDVIVVVVPTGFSGVHTARRMIETIKSYAPQTRIIPVLSDLRRDARLGARDITSTIMCEICTVVPRSETALMRAHRAARPLVELQPRGSYAKAVRAIWTKVQTTAANDTAPRKPLFKRMFQ